MQLTESPFGMKDTRYLELREVDSSRIAPLACTLSATDQQDRLEQWDRVLGVAEHRTSVTDGLVLRFRLDLELSHALTTLIHAELECCSFFVFQLSLDSHFMTLTVTAPGHGLDVVEQMFRRS
ncbi:hypothetical protein [Rhodococcus erythropolis]|uniref:hypothetical protein n=1 Tax=Rhodococcus erythropolis TaxID=1833 RepID=UPI0022B33391|nr:hypothetical protein [Rhodococcus erythropolis]MCZ4570195.1 hypothetical protein [Rhodococcus erythropolis]